MSEMEGSSINGWGGPGSRVAPLFSGSVNAPSVFSRPNLTGGAVTGSAAVSSIENCIAIEPMFKSQPTFVQVARVPFFEENAGGTARSEYYEKSFNYAISVPI